MNAFSILMMALYLLTGLTIVTVILALVFGYCLKNNLKKVYKVVLIVILIIVAFLDYILVNKSFPTLSLALVIFQVVVIPIIAWHRPEYDFSDKDSDKDKK